MSQGIVLKKNQAISLDKGLRNVLFTIEWDTHADMDIHALMLSQAKSTSENPNPKKQVKSDKDFIFFGNLEHPTGCIIHSGDILDGTTNAVGEEDETITVKLGLVPENVTEIIFTADIYEAAALGLDFSDVVGSVCRIINADNNKELASFKLDRDLNGEICAKIGRLYKKPNNNWAFEAIGEGVPSLANFLVSNGLKVSEE